METCRSALDRHQHSTHRMPKHDSAFRARRPQLAVDSQSVRRNAASQKERPQLHKHCSSLCRGNDHKTQQPQRIKRQRTLHVNTKHHGGTIRSLESKWFIYEQIKTRALLVYVIIIRVLDLFQVINGLSARGLTPLQNKDCGECVNQIWRCCVTHSK